MEGIALILGVDRLLDMCRTVVNVTGDAAVAVVVAASERELGGRTELRPRLSILIVAPTRANCYHPTDSSFRPPREGRRSAPAPRAELEAISQRPSTSPMQYNRRQVFAAACLGMLLFGIVSTTLGTILPSLLERYAVDKTAGGSIFAILSVGILLGSIVFGPIADRYGFKGLLISCAACILVGIEAVAFSPSFDVLRGAVLVLGFGAGIVNGGTNALVSDISPNDRSAGLSYLGVFFGIGAFGIPFILGFLLDRFSYVELTAGVGLPVAAVLVYFLFVRFPAPKQPHGIPWREGMKLARDPSLLIFGALLFLQGGIEMTTGGWVTTFFHEELGFRAGRAVFFLSLFWLGLTIARVAMGRLLRRHRPGRIMRIFVVVALAGAVMMVMSHTVWLAAPGIFLTGFGLAAGFPVVLGFAGDRYPALSGTAFSLLFVMSLIGSSAMPYLTGALGDGIGLRGAFLAIPIALVIQIGVLRLAKRRMDVVDRTA